MPRKPKNQRKDKRFCVRLDIGRDEDGKRIRKPFYSYVSLEDAEAERDEYVRLHPAAANPADRDITFGAWAERWLKTYSKGIAVNTYNNRRYSLNSLKRIETEDGPLENLILTEIRPVHVQTVMGSLANKSIGTISMARFLLKNIFDTAIDNYIIAESPYKRIKASKGTYKGNRAIEDWEKDIIKETWHLHRTGMWAMIALYAGLRRGELAALEWEKHIDLKSRILHVDCAVSFDNNQPKTKDTKTTAGMRDIPIFDPLYEALSSVSPDDRKGYVCISARGRRLTESAFDRGWGGWKLVCERAANDIKPYEHTAGWRRDLICNQEKYRVFDVGAHDLRYTFATMLYDADTDVKTAQYLLGHDDLMTTMKIYTKLSEKKKAKTIGKLRKKIK